MLLNNQGGEASSPQRNRNILKSLRLAPGTGGGIALLSDFQNSAKATADLVLCQHYSKFEQEAGLHDPSRGTSLPMFP